MLNRTTKMWAEVLKEVNELQAIGTVDAKVLGVLLERKGLYVDYIKPISTSGPSDRDFYETVILHFNKTAGTNFPIRLNSANFRLILGWRKKGYELQDLIEVIEKKSLQWVGTHMQEALTPAILFSLKSFENYLGQKIPIINANTRPTEPAANIDDTIRGAKRAVQPGG